MSWNDILFESVKNSDLEQVRQCLANGADVNARDNYDGYGSTPLMLASHSNNLEIVKYLVECGADVLAECKSYHFDTISTALSIASDNEIKQYLEIKVQEANLVDCASRGDISGVSECLANGVSANATHKGATALMLACKNGHYEVALTLITAGADINAKDINDKSVSQYAAEGGNAKIMELLLAQGMNNSTIN